MQTKRFSEMARQELLDYCRELYKKSGFNSLTYPGLKSIPTLYYNLYAKGLPQRVLLNELGLWDDFKQWMFQQPLGQGPIKRQRWSWDVIVEKANVIATAEGRLPPVR